MNPSTISKNYNGGLKQLDVKAVVGKLDRDEILSSAGSFMEQLRAEQGYDRVDVFYLNLYSHVRSMNYGLPIVSVQWINDYARISRKPINHDEKQGECYFKWHKHETYLAEMIEENEKSDEELIGIFNDIKEENKDIFMTIDNHIKLFKSDRLTVEDYRSLVLKWKDKLDEAIVNLDELAFPKNHDETQIQKIHELGNFVNSIHNIAIVASNKSYNEERLRHLSKLYIESARESLELIE